MTKSKLNKEINEYLDSNWNQITEDIATLIRIPSSAKDNQYNEHYPTGTGSYKAMKAALKIAKRMGFKTKNFKNIMGIADIAGESKTQIGIIGHCDVVDPGPGWKFNPYDLSIVDNYMIGRGVIDDKGPIIMFLHAVNFWLKKGIKLPYSIRFLFGTDEETNCSDVKNFKENFYEPKVVITPDGDFPICYGEKGLYRFKISSKKITKPQILSITAGTSLNAISGRATAIIKAKNQWIDVSNSRLAHAIKVNKLDDKRLEIIATGRSTHAAEPYEGIDSIAVLCQFLLEKNIGNADEKEFILFLSKIAGKPNGKEVDLDFYDEHFKSLTIVPTKLRYENSKFMQWFDVRYPICTNEKQIERKIIKHMPKTAKFERLSGMKPFIINPESKLVNALAKAYTEATGDFAKIFTTGGATYAREFLCAASFGPMMEWKPSPAWVGSLHGPDEGISIDTLQSSFNIYVYAIKYLMELDLDSKDFVKDAKNI